jgi:hypothetical protein
MHGTDLLDCPVPELLMCTPQITHLAADRNCGLPPVVCRQIVVVPQHRYAQLIRELPVACQLMPASGQLAAQPLHFGLGFGSPRLDSASCASLSRHGQADWVRERWLRERTALRSWAGATPSA